MAKGVQLTCKRLLFVTDCGILALRHLRRTSVLTRRPPARVAFVFVVNYFAIPSLCFQAGKNEPAYHAR
jgi:hypothetical protein